MGAEKRPRPSLDTPLQSGERLGKPIDEAVWMVTAVRHSLSSSGYTSQLTLETQHSEGVDGGDKAAEN